VDVSNIMANSGDIQSAKPPTQSPTKHKHDCVYQHVATQFHGSVATSQNATQIESSITVDDQSTATRYPPSIALTANKPAIARLPNDLTPVERVKWNRYMKTSRRWRIIDRANQALKRRPEPEQVKKEGKGEEEEVENRQRFRRWDMPLPGKKPFGYPGGLAVRTNKCRLLTCSETISRKGQDAGVLGGGMHHVNGRRRWGK
jgi:hypothetical protein